MMLVIEPTSKSAKTTFLALFIELLHPNSRADGLGILAERLASLFITLLRAEQPLVVPIPAVQCLVLADEAKIAGSSADCLHLAEACGFLLAELRDRRRKNLNGEIK
jgi:hypothetical protein